MAEIVAYFLTVLKISIQAELRARVLKFLSYLYLKSNLPTSISTAFGFMPFSRFGLEVQYFRLSSIYYTMWPQYFKFMID